MSASPAGRSAATASLRGSSLLLAGRMMALGVDFAAHVLVVRYLAKAEFGAYSYALAVSNLLATAVLLGLPETLARYVPIYRERGEIGKAGGAVVVAGAIVAGAGAVCVAVVLALPGLTASALDSERTAALLAVLVLLVPIEGVNLVGQALFAALGRVRLVFMRQYIVVPGLRFAVVLTLVAAGYGATFLAVGWVLASAAGLLLYVTVSLPSARKAARALDRRLELPARELLTFALPVFLSTLFLLALVGSGTVALGLLGGPEQVAELQAVMPPARLNLLVLTVFSVLYVPTAATLFARGDLAELRRAYNATTLWLVVLSLPVLALTTVFAPVFVPTVFGQQYASSIDVLALLAAGFFFTTAIGPNGSTLKVFRRLRFTVTIDLVSLVLGTVLVFALVYVAGTRGAALGTLIAIVGRNLALQAALHHVIGGSVLGGAYVRLVAGAALVLAVLLAIQLLLAPGLVVAVVLSGLGGLALVFAARRALDVEGTFPEIAGTRLGRLLGY